MTAVAALEATLERIARLNEDYRPYARLDNDGAMRAAAASDAAWREGRWLGLLHRMLVAIKDNIDTAGVRTSCGSALFTDRVPTADAPVVERLRRRRHRGRQGGLDGTMLRCALHGHDRGSGA
jgi:aspartyl-tRNA(Asn)/glutamyl-tRNA(Gln) amidotransferase subunit A